MRIVSQAVLKIKPETGVGLHRIGALYAADGEVKGDVDGGLFSNRNDKNWGCPIAKRPSEASSFCD